MYKISIETHFAASHQLHGYQGPCKTLHGHTWRVRVEVKSDRIDDIGISVDFKDLKRLTHDVIERLDHKHINDIPPFDRENPTAENLARYIYAEVKQRLPGGVNMVEVVLWESANYAVTYSES